MEKLQPKLRFPEFEKDWEIQKLGGISTFINGKAFNQSELKESGKYPILRVGNLFTNNQWYYSDLELDGSKYIDCGDLIYAWSATFGPRIWNGGKVIYHYHIWKVECGYSINKLFYYHLLNNETLRMKNNSSNGFALLHITKGTIENWKSSFPSLPEQTKIASFLTTVDEKISGLKKQLTLLERYKKGVMQKIFSQKLRFKDENGNDFPDWEEIFLNEILKTITTGLNPRKNFKLGEGQLYYVTIKNIKSGKIDFSNADNINLDAKSLINARSKLDKNDIIMSSIGNIGESFLLKEIPANWDINESLFNLKPNSRVIPSFLFFVLSSPNAKKYFENNSTGSSFKSIKMQVLKQFNLKLPSIPEQQKIASFLSSIDEKIEKCQCQIKAMERWKKGLLQQMFV